MHSKYYFSLDNIITILSRISIQFNIQNKYIFVKNFRAQHTLSLLLFNLKYVRYVERQIASTTLQVYDHELLMLCLFK